MSDECWIAGLAYSPLPGRASPRRRFIKSAFPPLSMGSPASLASPLPSPPITPNSTTPPPPRRGSGTTPPPRPKSRTHVRQNTLPRLGGNERQGSLGGHERQHSASAIVTGSSPPASGSSPSSDGHHSHPTSLGLASPRAADVLPTTPRELPTSPRALDRDLGGPKRIALRELLPRVLATPALEDEPEDLSRFARLQTLALHIFQDPCAFDQDDLARFLAQPLDLDALRAFSDTVLDAWSRAAPAAIRIPPNAPIRIVDPNSDLSNLDATPLELCSAATCACLLWTNLHPERWLQVARATHARGGGALDLSAEVRVVPTEEPMLDGAARGVTRSGMGISLMRVRVPPASVLDSGFVGKVRQGLQPWQRASHASLVPLLGVHEEPASASGGNNGQPTMSLVCASAARTRLGLALPKTVNEGYRMMRALAKALRYLHQLRVPLVHGGVRPDVVLVTPQGEAQLAEAGVTKILEELAAPGERTMPPGGLRYTAPELFGENRVLAKRTARSDVYAWGCVVYEVFSGSQPFADIPENRVPRALYDGQTLRRPTNPVLPINDDLWTLISRCTAFDLSRRPTMVQVVQMLTAARVAEATAAASAAATGLGQALEPSAIMALVESASKVAVSTPVN